MIEGARVISVRVMLSNIDVIDAQITDPDLARSLRKRPK
jgi:hypothetical protein